MEMTIGRLARAAGVSVETVRYYERIGLLAQPARGGTYRRYDDAHLVRLKYISNAKALQLSLNDIAALAREVEAGPAFCQTVRSSVRDRLTFVEAELLRLEAVRAGLMGFLETCSARPADQPCPVLADLRSTSAPSASTPRLKRSAP